MTGTLGFPYLRWTIESYSQYDPKVLGLCEHTLILQGHMQPKRSQNLNAAIPVSTWILAALSPVCKTREPDVNAAIRIHVVSNGVMIVNLPQQPIMASNSKPKVLHIGDPIKFNHKLYDELSSQFDIIRPSLEHLQRQPFMDALKNGDYGSFDAILRPFWNTGGEMGQWDKELISLLPSSVKVFASAGAGYNWADIDVLAEHGTRLCQVKDISAHMLIPMQESYTATAPPPHPKQ
jgi:hypothetical protein